MAYNPNKDLKLYYSIKEVAGMLNVNDSLLRFWEKEFPQIAPKKAGRGIRQYRKEDVETIKLIYHLVKEKGMTLAGARQRLAHNKEAATRNLEVINRLREIKEELLSIRKELDRTPTAKIN
jgi:DNA-binding transcriptional MerR regulator